MPNKFQRRRKLAHILAAKLRAKKHEEKDNSFLASLKEATTLTTQIIEAKRLATEEFQRKASAALERFYKELSNGYKELSNGASSSNSGITAATIRSLGGTVSPLRGTNYVSVGLPVYYSPYNMPSILGPLPVLHMIKNEEGDIPMPPEPEYSLDNPDYVEPIRAWRAWSLKKDWSGLLPDAEGRVKTETPALYIGSVGNSLGWPWPAREPIVARCISSVRDHRHGKEPIVPAWDCTCGIWAFKTADICWHAARNYYPQILGEVYLWGKIIETENGYRAQYAYPARLWVSSAALLPLGDTYNVPCIYRPLLADLLNHRGGYSTQKMRAYMHESLDVDFTAEDGTVFTITLTPKDTVNNGR